jgi:hypothetical protein
VCSIIVFYRVPKAPSREFFFFNFMVSRKRILPRAVRIGGAAASEYWFDANSATRLDLAMRLRRHRAALEPAALFIAFLTRHLPAAAYAVPRDMGLTASRREISPRSRPRADAAQRERQWLSAAQDHPVAKLAPAIGAKPDLIPM